MPSLILYAERCRRFFAILLCVNFDHPTFAPAYFFFAERLSGSASQAQCVGIRTDLNDEAVAAGYSISWF